MENRWNWVLIFYSSGRRISQSDCLKFLRPYFTMDGKLKLHFHMFSPHAACETKEISDHWIIALSVYIRGDSLTQFFDFMTSRGNQWVNFSYFGSCSHWTDRNFPWKSWHQMKKFEKFKWLCRRRRRRVFTIESLKWVIKTWIFLWLPILGFNLAFDEFQSPKATRRAQQKENLGKWAIKVNLLIFICY